MTHPSLTEHQPHNSTVLKYAEPGKLTGFGASAEFGAHVFKVTIPAGRAGDVMLTEDYGYLAGLEGTPEHEVRAILPRAKWGKLADAELERFHPVPGSLRTTSWIACSARSSAFSCGLLNMLVKSNSTPSA